MFGGGGVCANEVPPVAGTQRAVRHRLWLKGRNGCSQPMEVEVTIAAPPARHRSAAASDTAAPPIILYVLDPEPMLFGAAALFAYAQAPYGKPGKAESSFQRMYVVGVGHSGGDFALDGEGFDPVALRQIRRRDFPPRDHPTFAPGRGPNANAQRFVDGLVQEVLPFVEREVLGPHGGSGGGSSTRTPPPRRAIIGASYSAVVALQAMLRHPAAFQDFVLGSPSVVFDPEILDDVREGGYADTVKAVGGGALILLGERENAGVALAGNVHDNLVSGAHDLGEALRGRGLSTEGPHEVLAEDHSSVKLSVVSRGLTWIAERALRSSAGVMEEKQ